MQSSERIERDFADNKTGVVRNDKGQLRVKFGRPQKLSGAQASLIFECQVQINAAQKLIDRTLIEAGFSSASGRSYILKHIWRARGRVGVPHKATDWLTGDNWTRRPSAQKRGG